jgi:hypothetical protein
MPTFLLFEQILVTKEAFISVLVLRRTVERMDKLKKRKAPHKQPIVMMVNIVKSEDKSKDMLSCRESMTCETH